MGTVHVIPIDDLKEHTETEDCECQPVVKYVDEGKIVTHNSYDGREFFERWEADKNEFIQ